MGIAVISALSPSLDAPFLGIPISPIDVPAGFPSPAQDYFTGRIDLNKHLIIL